MPPTLDWKDIALRLALTVFAGAVIGFNRGEHGRPAGLRTTILVCLAASLSMILANILLNTNGKPTNSFIVADVMRLPLGILSGMGFIGAGTILRKGSLVLGVTTAATLWFVTMMGICFGSGQHALGLATLALGWTVLWGLKFLETAMPQEARGTLNLTLLNNGALPDATIREQLAQGACTIISWSFSQPTDPQQQRQVACEIQWQTRTGNAAPPPVLTTLQNNPAVTTLKWQSPGQPGDLPSQ